LREKLRKIEALFAGAGTAGERLAAEAVMMSSTTPSARYSCSGSPLKFWNGKAAMEFVGKSQRICFIRFGGLGL
jgi:hypothetical protein